jgi:hypothetical protein
MPLAHNDPTTGEKIVNMDALLRNKQMTHEFVLPFYLALSFLRIPSQGECCGWRSSSLSPPTSLLHSKYKHTQANLERNHAKEHEGKGKGHEELWGQDLPFG